MKQVSAKASDRREYFRINDQVALSYRSVTSDEVEAALAKRRAGHEDTHSIASSFAKANIEMNHGLDRCRKEMPELAVYLESINTKMEFLIRLLVASQGEMPDHPTHNVNLSASGMSFCSTESMPLRGMMEVKLLLFPTYLYLVTFATVVRSMEISEAHPQFPYELGIEFVHMEEADRELLIRHVLSREATLLREARNTPVSQRP